MNVDPKKLTVSEIIETLDGNYQIEEEEVPEDIHGRGVAVSIQKLVIDRLNEELQQILTDITLDDLRKSYLDNKEYDQDMYYI